MSDLDEFRRRYERHVQHVVDGDVAAALAEMVPERLPEVFEGIDVPRGEFVGYEIRDVRAEGELMIGEAVYDLADRRVGLRSIWERHDGTWWAATLENFPVDAV